MNYKQRYAAIKKLEAAINTVVDASLLGRHSKAIAVAEVLKHQLGVLDLENRMRKRA